MRSSFPLTHARATPRHVLEHHFERAFEGEEARAFERVVLVLRDSEWAALALASVSVHLQKGIFAFRRKEDLSRRQDSNTNR
jgi:hypothetical protein